MLRQAGLSTAAEETYFGPDTSDGKENVLWVRRCIV